MISLNQGYFKEVRKAAGHHQDAGHYQDAPSVLEVLELQKRFSLWADGVRGLDRKLEGNSKVRGSIVSDLAGLVLILSGGSTNCSTLKLILPLTSATGEGLFPHECQQTLRDKTNRVLEQASKIAFSHLKHPVRCPPLNILGFCNSATEEIKSRIGNLYDLTSTIQHLVGSFDETEPRQAEETGVGEGCPFSDSHINRVPRRNSRSFKQVRSTTTPFSQFLSTFHGAKNSHKPHSDPSKSSTKKSYHSTDPSSIPTILPDIGAHDSANTLTDPVTSDSLSEVEQSSSKPMTSISARDSSSCKRCRTTFSDPAGIEYVESLWLTTYPSD